jgi:DNA-binding IclR family transcriptional regulator
MSSLETAVRVLRCYSTTCSELTVTEVAQRLSLPKSNISRLLRAMRDVGLLDSARDGRGYSPGVMLLGFGQVAGAGHSLGVRADAAVARVSELSGHAGFVSARVGRQMVGLTNHAGRNPLQVGIRLGGNPLPIDACATGRAYLASLPDDDIRALLGNQVSGANPQSPATVDELLARVARVRSSGYAESRNEVGKGVGAIAVAVSDSRTAETLSLCITFPEATVDDGERRSLAEQLLKAQSDIMRNLNEYER